MNLLLAICELGAVFEREGVDAPVEINVTHRTFSMLMAECSDRTMYPVWEPGPLRPRHMKIGNVIIGDLNLPPVRV